MSTDNLEELRFQLEVARSAGDWDLSAGLSQQIIDAELQQQLPPAPTSWTGQQETREIEIPFSSAPSWLQQAWNDRWPGTRPSVFVVTTEIARIGPPYSDYVVRDIVAYNASTGEIMTAYVPSYDTLISSVPEDQSLYFGGAVGLSQGRSIAVMDQEDRYRRIHLYVHPSDYESPMMLAPTLTERQQNILATARAYTPKYMREVLGKHDVTEAELNELRSMGLLKNVGGLTLAGRNVARDFIQWP